MGQLFGKKHPQAPAVDDDDMALPGPEVMAEDALVTPLQLHTHRRSMKYSPNSLGSSHLVTKKCFIHDDHDQVRGEGAAGSAAGIPAPSGCQGAEVP